VARKAWIAAARIADIGARALAGARRRLGPRDRRRHAAFGSGKRRREFLAGRWLLEQSARAWRPDSRLRFDSSPAGGISVNRRVGASVSHARGWVACALVESGRPGIDIEPMVERDFAALDKWVADDEGDAAQSVDRADARKAFYRRWTRYEARLKALGGAKRHASHVEITYYLKDDIALSVCLPSKAATQVPRTPVILMTNK
jgi:4'-phosphopantetheinyl transferase